MFHVLKDIHKNTHKLIILILIFLPIFCYALTEDTKQKVYIVGDTCIYNYKLGTSVFEGHVKVDQGTTHITADKLTTKNNKQHKVEETIAYGIQELAHYWTVVKVGDPEIHAKAKVIKFYPITSNVTLEQEVNVVQGDNNFHGELIHYNFNKQTITVPASKKGRAVLVYNPEK